MVRVFGILSIFLGYAMLYTGVANLRNGGQGPRLWEALGFREAITPPGGGSPQPPSDGGGNSIPVPGTGGRITLPVITLPGGHRIPLPIPIPHL